MLTLEQVLKIRKRSFTDEIGIEFTKLENGSAEGNIMLEKRHLNYYGSAHGGCIFSLMDSVAGLAALSNGSYVTTAGGNVHYINAAIGTRFIRAAAKPVKIGNTLLVYDVEVLDDANKLIAKGSFTFVRFGEIKE